MSTTNSYYKLTYFEIKQGQSGPTVDKYFNTRAEISRFISIKKNTLADIVVYDLHNNKIVTDQFRRFIN